MLRETSITELRAKVIDKKDRVLVNRGRGNDELAPSASLYQDFDARKKERENELGKGSPEAHNAAFLDCGYERRFRDQIAGDPAALTRLEELARQSERAEVYLVCYEGPAKACHRRILLRIAEERFGANVCVEGVEPS